MKDGKDRKVCIKILDALYDEKVCSLVYMQSLTTFVDLKRFRSDIDERIFRYTVTMLGHILDRGCDNLESCA